MKLSFQLLGFFLIGLFLFASVVNADPSQTASKQIGDLINQERYDDAIALANRLARQTPNNPFIYSNRGQAYMYKSQWQKALDDYNQAIKLDPEVWIFYHFRGRLYDTLGYLEKAVASYDKSISLYPQAAMSISRRGYLHWLLGRYDQAVRDAGRLIEINPSQFNAFRFRSLCHWVEGRKDQAVEDMQSSLKLSPQDVRSYLHLGYYMHSLNQTDQAQGYIARADELNPDALRVIEITIKISQGPRTRSFYENEVAVVKSYLEGQPLPSPQNLNQKKPMSGEKISDESKDLEMPGFSIVLEEPGGDDFEFFDLLKNHRYDEAIALAGQRIAQNPNAADNYYLRSLAYRRKRQLDPALADINKAVSLAPSDYALIFSRGEIYLESRRFDSAAAEFTQALQLIERGEIYVSPSREEIYKKRAEAFWWQGRIERVINDCSRALVTELPDLGTLILRSKARWISGDTGGAVKDAEAAVENDPLSGGAHFHLAFFLQKTGRLALARTHFTEAFELNPEMMKNISVYYMHAESERLKRFYQEEANEAQAYMPKESKPNVPPKPKIQKPPIDTVRIEIYKVRLKPERIITGTQVELLVEYRIDEGNVAGRQISVELAYFILSGTDVLLQESGNLSSALGRRTISNALFAAGESGNYSVKVRLRYKGETAERTVPLVIR